MKTFQTILLMVISTFCLQAQNFSRIDKSVLDIAYLPHNFAHDREAGDEAIIKVVYSRPLKNDRIVFGGLVPFEKVWRTGANESTEIRFYKDVKFGGEAVKAGSYSMFSIPGEETWTIILNSELDYWGHYSYNEATDVLRILVPAKSLESSQEAFTIQFTKKGETPEKMMLAWDTVKVEVPIEY